MERTITNAELQVVKNYLERKNRNDLETKLKVIEVVGKNPTPLTIQEIESLSNGKIKGLGSGTVCLLNHYELLICDKKRAVISDFNDNNFLGTIATYEINWEKIDEIVSESIRESFKK